MRTISDITTELEVATALMQALRKERADALVAGSPRKVGEEFGAAGIRWKVKSIAAASKGTEVWVQCQKMLSSGKWSQGTTVHCLKVEG